MKLFIDTGTWLKLDVLSDLTLFEPNSLYDWADIFTTHQVDEELRHFNNRSINRSLTGILPVKNKKIYDEAVAVGFDLADASIISHGETDNPDVLIISEDRPLLKYAKMYRFYIIQLIDLFQVLAKQEHVSYNELYGLTREMQRLRNITRKKQEEIKNWLKAPS
ncbi:MAG TPA: hypothetical protein VKM55_15060 [Candidatus Lokiarchaeia archaeon]|nr:hypothetical protein [Candidatus Lokiarchaeia archaeon]